MQKSITNIFAEMLVKDLYLQKVYFNEKGYFFYISFIHNFSETYFGENVFNFLFLVISQFNINVQTQTFVIKPLFFMWMFWTYKKKFTSLGKI